MKPTASGKKKSNGNVTSTKKLRLSRPKFAVCVDNSDYPASLELNKIYQVLRDERAFQDGELRVVDESGEDYLYSAQRFVPIELPKKVRASVTKGN